MSCPAKLCFKEHGLNAGNLGHFMDLDVCDEDGDADGDDMSLRTQHHTRDKHNSFVDIEICLFL